MTADNFNASPSLAGYLWQVHHAFLSLMDTELTQRVSIEEFDDVVVLDGKGILRTSVRSLQMKHSLDASELGLKSVELWKTLRVWSTAWMSRTDRPQHLVLATTDEVAESLEALADPGTRSVEDTVQIRKGLDTVAQEAANQKLHAAYKAWLSLSSADRAALLGRVRILAAQSRLVMASKATRDRIEKFGVPKAKLDFAQNFLLGWFHRVVDERLGFHGCEVERWELQEKLFDMHRLMKEDVLTTLHAAAPHPGLEDERATSPVYLRQLDLLGANDRELQNAVAMFYRASAERNSLLQRRLRGSRDLAEYDGDLQNKWSSVSARHSREVTEEIRSGWAVHDDCMAYNGVMSGQHVPTHLANGSFHILANGPETPPRIGWHPKFAQKLSQRDPK